MVVSSSLKTTVRVAVAPTTTFMLQARGVGLVDVHPKLGDVHQDRVECFTSGPSEAVPCSRMVRMRSETEVLIASPRPCPQPHRAAGRAAPGTAADRPPGCCPSPGRCRRWPQVAEGGRASAQGQYGAVAVAGLQLAAVAEVHQGRVSIQVSSYSRCGSRFGSWYCGCTGSMGLRSMRPGGGESRRLAVVLLPAGMNQSSSRRSAHHAASIFAVGEAEELGGEESSS